MDNGFKYELVIGIVAPVGVNLDNIQNIISDHLQQYGYDAKLIRLSNLIKNLEFLETKIDESSPYKRIDTLMSAGNEARFKSESGDIVSLLGINEINQLRKENTPNFNKAYLIRSLKHPAEVYRLRRVYGNGFFLIGFSSARKNKLKYLTERKGVKQEEAERLIRRDESEEIEFGQHTRDVFYLSDAFIDCDAEDVQGQIGRIFELIFSNPYITPTRDEYAMFMSFAASLRSGDLSRQVGAVITSINGEIIATGANDVPKSGGGLYWYGEEKDFRDFDRGYDSNERMRNLLIIDIMKKLKPDIDDEESLLSDGQELLLDTGIYNITEYGRSVHAEMEALMSCARIGVSAKGGTLYTTTFPCHNCAKHIVCAGIKRVVFIEPYIKSQAEKLHDDSINLLHESVDNDSDEKVQFQPFVGIGPRKFIDLFSISLSSGVKLKRKDKNGNIIKWEKGESTIRVPMLPTSYIEREMVAVNNLVEMEEEINATTKRKKDQGK